MFAEVGPDIPGALDAVHDEANMPLGDEPERVRADLDTVVRALNTS